jgi:hypothetical protein
MPLMHCVNFLPPPGLPSMTGSSVDDHLQKEDSICMGD